VVATIEVGLDPGALAYESGRREIFVANELTDTLSVISAGTVVTSPFRVQFSESGLTPGTSWSVTLNGSVLSSANTTDAFMEPDGTYAFTVGAVTGFTSNVTIGSLTVNGVADHVSIAFSPIPPADYTLTFDESGLPEAATWTVTLSGQTTLSNTAPGPIVFEESNGTYPFTLRPIPGYKASPSSGNVTVDGAPTYEVISFKVVTVAIYTVSFTERGLPTLSTWSVNFAGLQENSSKGTIVFTAQDGTYAYSVGPVLGYNANPSSGSVTLSGSNQSVTIDYATNSPGGSPSGLLGLPGDSGYLVVSGTLIIATLAVTLTLARRRRTPKGP
jgi:hypothetical protein